MPRSGLGILASLLLTVGILGALWASFGVTSKFHGPTVPTIISANLRSQCQQDVTAIVTAASSYNILHSVTPLVGPETGIVLGKPDTYSRGREATQLLASGLLPVWPTNSHFALSFSTSRRTLVAVYVPTGSPKPASAPPSVPADGCNAL